MYALDFKGRSGESSEIIDFISPNVIATIIAEAGWWLISQVDIQNNANYEWSKAKTKKHKNKDDICSIRFHEVPMKNRFFKMQSAPPILFSKNPGCQI